MRRLALGLALLAACWALAACETPAAEGASGHEDEAVPDAGTFHDDDEEETESDAAYRVYVQYPKSVKRRWCTSETTCPQYWMCLAGRRTCRWFVSRRSGRLRVACRRRPTQCLPRPW